MDSDERELGQLRQSLARLQAETRNNDEAWRRSQAAQVRLLEAETLSALLTRLSIGFRSTFELHDATLAVADPQHEMRRLLADQGLRAEHFPSVAFVDDVYGLAPDVFKTGRPWLGAYRESLHGRLFWNGAPPRSVAVLPVARQRNIVASVNFGSMDAMRFTRRHSADFLSHLAVIGAYCLENTLNRARLTRSGFTDALTGWHNRRYLQTRLQEELARCNRERRPLVCLMLDIDHFKRVNDAHGHLVGDEVLRQFALCMSREVRASDVAARYGGEEFVILMPKTALKDGHALAERIRASIAESTFSVGMLEEPLRLTASIGIAEYTYSPRGAGDIKADAEALLAAADLALYEAKAAGRDRVALAGGR